MVFFFSFSILFFFKSRARSVREHHSSFLLSNLPRLNASTNIGCSLIEPVSVYYFSSFLSWKLDPWRRFQIKLTPPPTHPPTQLISLQSAKLVAHVGDAVTWNRASFLCLYTEILRRMQCFTQKKRDSMQGLHSTHQLLKCLIMWEPLCAHLQRSVWQSWRVICVQNHAVCVQTVAPEVNAKTPPV